MLHRYLKKEAYAEYRAGTKEMQKCTIAQKNVEMLLNWISVPKRNAQLSRGAWWTKGPGYSPGKQAAAGVNGAELSVTIKWSPVGIACEFVKKPMKQTNGVAARRHIQIDVIRIVDYNIFV